MGAHNSTPKGHFTINSKIKQKRRVDVANETSMMRAKPRRFSAGFKPPSRGATRLPTYFIRNASLLESRARIVHHDLDAKTEVATENWLPAAPLTIGITAGASCPNNLIEESILRVFELHGIRREELIRSNGV